MSAGRRARASTRRCESGSTAEPELLEDLADVRLDRLRAQEELLADGLVRAALGDQREHLALAVGELVERALLARAVDEARDDRRVEHALALGDAPQRVGEHGDVGHAFLEQVADALGVVLEQAHRVAGRRGSARARARRRRGATSGSRCAATSPSSVCVGGILMSTIATSGRGEPDRAQELGAVVALPTTSKPASASRRARPSRRSISSSAITMRMGSPRAPSCVPASRWTVSSRRARRCDPRASTRSSSSVPAVSISTSRRPVRLVARTRDRFDAAALDDLRDEEVRGGLDGGREPLVGQRLDHDRHAARPRRARRLRAASPSSTSTAG